MKPLNLSGKILLIPFDKLPENTRGAIDREDGMQEAFGTHLFVYATGRVIPHHGCCCGGGHHHHEEGHECCGGGHHHHEEGHECCGGGGHHHEEGHECCGGGGHHHEEGHECCGGGGHHHHEEGHECCGGGGHHHEEGHECCGGGHHHHEEGHECCGGGGHHHEEKYDPSEADETYFGQEDLAYGKDEPIMETVNDNLLLVVNEPLVIVNTADADRLGFDPASARYFELPPDGITLVPGKDVDRDGFQTGPISINLQQ